MHYKVTVKRKKTLLLTVCCGLATSINQVLEFKNKSLSYIPNTVSDSYYKTVVSTAYVKVQKVFPTRKASDLTDFHCISNSITYMKAFLPNS